MGLLQTRGYCTDIKYFFELAVPSCHRPVVLKYKLVRLPTETGTVSRAVVFRGKSKYRGQSLAKKFGRSKGGYLAHVQRVEVKRRAELAQSPYLVSADLSNGKCAASYNPEQRASLINESNDLIFLNVHTS